MMLLIMETTVGAMLLACVGILTVDSYLFRQNLERDLTSLARIIGDNSSAALAFGDSAVAAESLDTLRSRTHMVAACIYESNGNVLARYMRSGAREGCPPPDPRDELRFVGDRAVVSRSISSGSERYGTLMMLYDLEEISERRRFYGTIVLGVLLLSGLIAYWLSSGLRALITDPISQLVKATTSVSETGDYAIRAHRFSGDELGVLVDRFNDMLAGIQSRDEVLTHALREREQALKDVESATERFRFLAESMPQKIFTATPAGEVDYFNRQWMEFTGLSFEQIKQWGWMRIVHPDDLEGNLRAWRDSLGTGEPSTFSTASGAPTALTAGICRAPAPCSTRTAASPCGSAPTPIFTNRRRRKKNCAEPTRIFSSSPIPPVTICRSRCAT